jgi:hypothetical protein
MEQVDDAISSDLYPPLSERQLIHKLITQYLSHDGYVETVKAFATELDQENAALGADDDVLQASSRELGVEESNDALTRQSKYQYTNERAMTDWKC